MDDLAKLKEATEKATPGPWFETEGYPSGRAYGVHAKSGPVVVFRGIAKPLGQGEYNAAFIALAREGVPELFTRLSAAEAAHASALARVAVLEGALREAREDILSFVHARWSEAEGSDEDHVGYIDAALRTEGEGQ